MAGSPGEVAVKDGWQPEGRRGACSFAYEGAVYLFQGDTCAGYESDEKLYRFLLREGKWEVVYTSGSARQRPNAVCGACCCLLGERLVVFGGWNLARSADLHQLDLSTVMWSKCDVKNPSEGPFRKDKAGMIPYGHDFVCVVGGYGYPSEHHIRKVHYGQKEAQYHWDLSNGLCWTNEVHLFQLSTGMWVSPQMTGQRPPPCAAFSLTMADSHRAVLFGGRQRERRVNDIYILHLDTWHWEGVLPSATPQEPWPTPRSFHATCSLVDPMCIPALSSLSKPHGQFDWLLDPQELYPSHPVPSLSPKLLVLWGMDNDDNVVSDCWILHLDPISWKRVDIPVTISDQPRLWHTVGVWHTQPAETQALVFGGIPESISSDNIFSGTLVFEFGVPSLYQLCVHFAAENDLLSPATNTLLPQKVIQKIEQCRTSSKQYQLFCKARL